MPFAEYAEYDGLGLAELIAKRAVSPSELVDEAIRRLERHNPTLNAVIYRMDELARAAAVQLDSTPAGAFRGVPFLLKDLLGNFEGVPTTFGSRVTGDFPALHDDTLVARFKRAGLIALGKTNVPEVGLLPTTEPRRYGPTRNPWSLEHSAGGSSGGSAAAVAAGIVPIAHANDAGGSIRIPASCCGLVGLKPTRGRNPLGPDIGDVANGLVAEHVVTRSVRDCAAVLDATHGPEPGDPYAASHVERPFLVEAQTKPGRLRIAFATRALDGTLLHPECVAAVEATAKLLAELGHEVEEASPGIDMGMVTSAFMAVFSSSTAMLLDSFTMLSGRMVSEDDVEGLTWGVYRMGKEVSASQYLMSIALLQMASRQVGRFHEQYDCWVTPTTGRPTLKLGVIDTSVKDAMAGMAPVLDYLPFTPIQNATGQPSMSLPLHWTADGLPLGVLLTGRLGDEVTLFRLAGQLEEARPWRGRHPAVWG